MCLQRAEDEVTSLESDFFSDISGTVLYVSRHTGNKLHLHIDFFSTDICGMLVNGLINIH